MKRDYLVKVKGYPAFTMVMLELDDDPEHVCRAIFGERLEWVR